ncbi:gustatory receptor for sugar taste 64f-like [Melitaea cinxia]|uniref:gustatory receptor for sugar taste 64f-like n=1 Tax=Melitaea cinxia TaxID=113334 RepID=UPI001E2704FC|nr:gustatory receptor for sugar taste 64f-like [Melitaea cinxia]
MKYCFVIGQWLGLFPITNITGRDVQNRKGVSLGSSNDFKCLHQQAGYRYEDLTYNLISGVIIIFRSFLVLLVASNIHSTSLVVAPSLYDVPSSSFCTEVQRFIEQIHGTTVALSGLKFFYVTKELLLSIFGTIVTYEVVLLNFRREKKIE